MIELLRGNEIQSLVDVRAIPRSRRNPQYDAEALAESLAAVGIAHRHAPGLGGLRRPRPDSRHSAWREPGFRGYADYMETAEFEHHLSELVDLATTRRTAILCAEAVPWHCHRMLVADALVARGLEVLHIVSTGPPEPHQLTPFARVEGVRLSYPGVLG